MPELQKMLKGQVSGATMIDDDIGDAGHAAMSGDDRGGHLRYQGKLRRVDGDDAFNQSLHKEPRILLEQMRLVAMTYNEIEITSLQQIVFDARKYESCVSLTNFRDKDANGKSLLLAK